MPRAPSDRVEALFDAALAEPTDARETFVREACGDDEALCREVLQLLEADAEADALLDTPAASRGGATGRSADERPLAEGDVVGDYVIEACVGAGGFGAVYRARHAVIGKRVAVKVLHADHAASSQLAERFVREARAVNEIGHPNIIDIFGFGQTPDGRMFYAMEYLDAPTLEDVLRRDGPMSLTHALPILRGLAAALDAAHARGIVHRDLKPANVILRRDPAGGWTPKLLDFGIAKLVDADEHAASATRTGQMIGTPAYMAPEQIRNAGVDGRADAYALGVLTFRMLTGRLPFTASNPFDVMVAHTQAVAPAPSSVRADLGPQVDAFVLQLLAKAPLQRPLPLTPAVAALAEGIHAPANSSGASRRILAAATVAAVLGAAAWAWTATRTPDRVETMPSAAGPSASPPRPSAGANGPAAPAPTRTPAAGASGPVAAPPQDDADPAPDGTSTTASEPTAETTTDEPASPRKSPDPRRPSLNADLESPFSR